MFRSLFSRVKQLTQTETARRVLAAVLCLALLCCTAGAALSLSFSVSAMRAEQQKEQNGGDEVLSYLPLAEFVRLSYSEPDLLLQLDASPSPEEIVIRREEQANLRKALADLPEQHRVILILREMDGLDYQEIAQVLDIELGTVKSRLSRARRALREKLLAQGNPLDGTPSNSEKGGMAP